MAMTPEQQYALALSRAMSLIGMSAKEAGEAISRLSKLGLAWDPITKTLYRKTGDENGKPE